MSEIDNLEALSNADLRKKCIEHGLPNVPITDSSRNVLIRKLRASLSGAPASSPKKTQRRETIHVSKVAEVADTKETKIEQERQTPSRGANRRTIAGTPTLESQKANQNQASESNIPAPIGNRRRSTRELEIPSSQRENKPTKNFNPVVILESDEEDNDLLKAAEQAEQKSKPSNVQNDVNVRSRSSRSVSLTKTGVVSTSYNQEILKPLAEVPEVPNRKFVSDNLPRDIPYKPSININTQRYSLHSNFSQPMSTGPSKIPSSFQSTRYSTNTLSGLYSSKVTPLLHEQSDDNEDLDQQDYETPFLSSFARNLERLKSDSVVLGKGTVDHGGDYASPRPMHRTKRFEITGRRPANDSVTESFRQFLIALDRKYNLRLYLILATVFLVLAFLYVIIYQ